MSNQHQSQICIEISSVINTAGKEILQKLYATDLYVYIEIAGKQILYLPEKEVQYLIDTTIEQLIKIDTSAHAVQFIQIKQLIGKLFLEEKPVESGRYIRLTNMPSSVVKLATEVEIVEFCGLEQTVISKFETFQSILQPVSIKLQSNEIIVSMKTNLVVNGQTQESRMKVLEIKKLENPGLFDKYLEFSEEMT
jgi:hypothetical protein